MKSALVAATVVLTCGQAGMATAGVYGDDLTRCLVRSTSTQDRVVFTRWMFSAMSANASVAELSTLTPQQRSVETRAASNLFSRLMLKDCRAEMMNALRYEGQTAFTSAFESFGRAAMTDLMADPAVAAELDALDDHIDEGQWDAFVKEMNAGRSTGGAGN